MIIDFEATFSKHQSLVGALGNFLSDKSYSIQAGDTIPAAFQSRGSAPRNPGKGQSIPVLVQVTEAIDGAAHTVTCQFQMVMADDEALTTNLVVLAETPAIAQATLVVGYKANLTGYWPVGITKAFLGMRYITAVENATTGKVYAAMMRGPGGLQTAGTGA